MAKVTLISPRWYGRGLQDHNFYRFPPIGLHSLAQETPRHWDIEIIDENKKPINFLDGKSPMPDIVGIGGMTAVAQRAYEIAARCKRLGIPVIMGGVHASFMHDEAMQFSDSVCIGEAEKIWPTILSDFESGKLKKKYNGGNNVDLGSLQEQREMASFAYYPVGRTLMLQSSRGCPHGCSFCSVSIFNGKRIRHYPIDYIVEQIKRYSNPKTPFSKYVIFIDDNIFADPIYAAMLFEKMIPLKIRWLSQGDIRIALDKNLLKLAVKSGLSAVFVGLESIDKEILSSDVSLIKAHWSDMYQGALETLAKLGILVQGAFVFGLDGQTKTVFEQTTDWAINAKLPLAQFSILTPLPGTPLFKQMEQDQRITAKLPNGTYDWRRFNAFDVSFRPDKLTENELLSGTAHAYKRFYSIPSIWNRMSTAVKYAPGIDSLLAIIMNLDFLRLPLVQTRR